MLVAHGTTRCGGREPSNPHGCRDGWRGRIRTFDLLIQSQAPYRLATRQWSGGDDTAGGVPRFSGDPLLPCRPWICRQRVWAGRATTGRRLTPNNPTSSNRPRRGPRSDGVRSGRLRPGRDTTHRPGHQGAPFNPEDDPEAFDAPPPTSGHGRSRYPAAILDALIPGLGHLVAGRRLRALLFVSPLLVLLATAAMIVATTSGPRLAATLLSAEVIWGLLAAQALLLASRLIAVGSSLSTRPFHGPTAGTCSRSPCCWPSSSPRRPTPATRPRSPVRLPTRSSWNRWRSPCRPGRRLRPELLATAPPSHPHRRR